MQHTNPADWIVDGPDADLPSSDSPSSDSPRADLTVAFAHGAGLPMDSPFMNVVAHGIAQQGYRVIRFEFPYMAKRRADGRKRPPNTMKVLRETWLEVIEQVGAERLVISGKSMGGRIASLVAEQTQVLGLICYGYPFHPPGKPDRLRVDHLAKLPTPTLILQGERDPFGRADEVEGYDLSPSIQVSWIPDGDHGFKPRKRSGLSETTNLQLAVDKSVRFLIRLT